MKTPRSRITFKTPKKRNIKTPLSLKRTKNKHTADKGLSTNNNNNTPLSLKRAKKKHTADKGISIDTLSPTNNSPFISTENTLSSLLESYRQENTFLRNLKNDSLLFQRLIGLSIKEVDGQYECTHTVTIKGITRYIVFLLVPDTASYVYKPISYNNVTLPEYLSDSISFTEEHIQMFFFKVMEALMC